MQEHRQNLIYLTNRVGRQLTRLIAGQLNFEGFQPQSTHLGLLSDLVQSDGLRQQDLAMSTIKDKGTVARALKQLDTAGMITRVIDPDDRRQKRIYLTEKGRCLWACAADAAHLALTCAQQNIPADDLVTCTNVLQQIYHNLHQQLSTPKSINHEPA